MKVTKFLTDLEGLITKLEGKKVEARKVIQSKMSDLHQLIDKWETRFLDTMTETLDEKIETINKQVRLSAVGGQSANEKRSLFCFFLFCFFFLNGFF